MPFGGEQMGFGFFVLTKYAGYTAYCKWAIEPRLHNSDHYDLPAAWKAGLLRTLIGVGIGAIVGLAFWKIPYISHLGDDATPWFFLLLVPIRIGEWWALLRLSYRDFEISRTRRYRLIVSGIVVSFLLDALGVFAAFVLPGGMWVC